MTMHSDRLRVRVAAKQAEAKDICRFELVDTAGESLPSFTAGSHIDVEIDGGLTRQYSLCNPPSERHRYEIAVLREPNGRGGSVAMHDRVQVGDEIVISAPRNHFELARDASTSLLLAGGIGITPIMCMASHLAATGSEFELHYCCRSRDRAAFADRIADSSFAEFTQYHFSDGPAWQRLDIGRTLTRPKAGAHLYVCGPAGFIDAVLGTARTQGWPEGQVHREFFAAQFVATGNDAAFEVEIASTGRVVIVGADQTVAQALCANGIEIQTSCEQGVCGTCITRVLAGEPLHRDQYFTPEELAANNQFTPCCSRAKSPRLVLDL